MSLMRPPPREFAARAEAPPLDIDFDSHEPSAAEKGWGAVAYPVPLDRRAGRSLSYLLATPLEALSIRIPEYLFGSPERVAAGHARAKALLKLRAEGEKDVGGD